MLLLAFLTPPISLLLSHALGFSGLFPVLAGLGFYPAFYLSCRQQQWGKALYEAFLWALVLTLSLLFYLHAFPQGVSLVLKGESYRAEMIPWVQTGVGKESAPALFIPEHLLHLTLFALLTYLSAGALGLVMGAFQMNYMNAYVAWVMEGMGPAGALLGWHPWAVIRVLAYITLGVYLTGLRLKKAPPKELLYLSLGGLLVDAGMKALLAPSYSVLLRNLL